MDNENPYEKIKKELLHRYPSLDSIGLEKGSLSLDRYEILTDLFPNVSFSANLTPVIETMQLKDSRRNHYANLRQVIGLMLPLKLAFPQLRQAFLNKKS